MVSMETGLREFSLRGPTLNLTTPWKPIWSAVIGNHVTGPFVIIDCGVLCLFLREPTSTLGITHSTIGKIKNVASTWHHTTSYLSTSNAIGTWNCITLNDGLVVVVPTSGHLGHRISRTLISFMEVYEACGPLAWISDKAYDLRYELMTLIITYN
jgi:hypothetical protein